MRVMSNLGVRVVGLVLVPLLLAASLNDLMRPHDGDELVVAQKIIHHIVAKKVTRPALCVLLELLDLFGR